MNEPRDLPLLRHPLLPLLVPYFNIEVYDRDGGHKNPRKRIELQDWKMPPELVRQALELQVPCVRCGASIHPFRARRPSATIIARRHVYCAVACTLAQNVGCSRGPEARDAYVLIIEHVRRLQQVGWHWRNSAMEQCIYEATLIRNMYPQGSAGWRIGDYTIARLNELLAQEPSNS